MNFRIVKALYKKEILDVLRDKKTVIMMLIVPLILYPLMIVVGLQLMTKITTDMSEQNYTIGIGFEEDVGVLEEIFQKKCEEGHSFTIMGFDEISQFNEGGDIWSNVDAFIERVELDGKDTFVIHYLSADTNSGYATDLIIEVLNDYSLMLTTSILEEAGLDSEYVLNPVEIAVKDNSTTEESAGNLLGGLVPFMLVTSLLMGTMYPAIDTTAGEKERGTLETVLTLPVTNQELFFSKFLTVATIGLASALLNIISMGGIGIYMYNTVLSVSGMSGINVNQFVPAICIALLCVFAFAVFISAISMCVCVFAKSYKEANNYITPLTLVVMFASMVSIVPNVNLTSNMALVPVANICLLIRDLLVFKYDISIIMLVLISNVIYGMLSVIILGKIYNSEAILFGDGSASLQIFEKRSNMKKGGVPSLGDMVLIIAITIVATIYIGGAIQLKWGYYGVLCTQFIILIIPIFAAWYTKKDIKETFRLRIPRLGYVLGGIMSVVGALLLGMIITGISSYIFKSSATELGESMNAILGDSFIETLLLVAVVPAFCEEIMFRGYVLSSMDKVFKPRNAIIVSGIIFGLYHMNLVQSFTTAFLGIVIGYVAYKSGSIFPGVIMHFINNALACVVMYYPETVKKILPILVKETFTTKDMIIVFVVGLVILTMGIFVVKTTSKNKK